MHASLRSSLRPAAVFVCMATFGSLMLSTAAYADEPLFGFVYTTDLLPKGKWEVAQWATWRAHKAHGRYNVVELRNEVEYGGTDNLQLSAYINYEWANAFHNNVMDGSTLVPETFAQLSVDPDDKFETTRLTGVAGEVIWRVLSPYTDGVGLALYIEPTIGPALRELESRIILQKNFLDDRIVLAFNATIAQEWRRLQADPTADPDSSDFIEHWDKETDVNFGLAGSYRFAPSWSAGVELINEREWAGLSPLASSKRTNTAYYFGPTLHYAGAHVFATLTAVDQLPWGADAANPRPGFVVSGRNYADDFERFRVRLKIGYYF